MRSRVSAQRRRVNSPKLAERPYRRMLSELCLGTRMNGYSLKPCCRPKVDKHPTNQRSPVDLAETHANESPLARISANTGNNRPDGVPDKSTRIEVPVLHSLRQLPMLVVAAIRAPVLHQSVRHDPEGVSHESPLLKRSTEIKKDRTCEVAHEI